MESMDKLKLGLRALLPEQNASSGISSPGQTEVLVRRAPIGRVVSLSTCGKICAVSFVVGVVVGFTLKRRLRNWAKRLLKGLKDD
ncbi:uncharacterized protein LOC141834324 [Curcuma longa]|uniref:uncharacterized protein LOC141834324 n=1 Tax=Curcuma longa TaxID=136217 RepID=UPI003D9E252F